MHTQLALNFIVNIGEKKKNRKATANRNLSILRQVVINQANTEHYDPGLNKDRLT